MGAFNLELRANNDVNFAGSQVYVGDNRSLTVVADTDVSGVGNVLVDTSELRVGSSGSNTTGNMAISGNDVTVERSGSTFRPIQVYGAGSQTIAATTGDLIFRNNGFGADFGSMTVSTTTGPQVISAAQKISIIGGTGTGADAVVQSGGGQTITANQFELLGGASGTNNRALIYTLNASNQTAVIGAGGIILQAGSAGASNSADLYSTGNQDVAAAGIALTGGAGGGGTNTGNKARISADGSQAITVGSGGISVTGGGGALSDNLATIYQGGGSGTSQSVTVSGGGSILLQGGSSALTNVGGFGHGSLAGIEAHGDSQLVSFSAGGTLSVTGGTVGSRNLASVWSAAGSQTITGATAITLSGGANGGVAGEGNYADISASVGNQNISVGSGGLTVTGGSGSLTDRANYASVYQGAAGATQTITSGGNITLQGGSSAGTSVGFDGSSATITSQGTAQLIEFNQVSRSLTITGGSVGSRNNAFVSAPIGTQTIRGTTLANDPSIVLTGGASGGIAGEGNNAGIFANGGPQTIAARAITLQGGAAGLGNFAGISTGANQNITVGSGGINLTGGGGPLSDNAAAIDQYGALGTSQTIVVNSGGSIVMQGGSSAQSNVGGGGHGSRAHLASESGTQTITFTSGGQLQLIGGSVGSRNRALIYAGAGPSQTIVGADMISLQGGASGGITGEGNFASIYAGSGDQTIAVGAGGITISGGSGGAADRNNYAEIYQGGLAGTSQSVTVAGGGSIHLQGGSSAGINVGANNGSTSYISAYGDTQLIEFTGPGSAISIVGGTVGSNNNAGIYADNGTQTIRGSSLANAPSITVTGGASGGVAGEGNFAGFSAATGAQNITAKATTLLGGGGGLSNSAFFLAETQTLQFSGDLNLVGSSNGDSSNNPRIGGRGGSGNESNTNLTLGVTGNLTLSGGTSSGVVIGSAAAGVGLTNNIVITTTGDVVMAPSATQGMRIGSPAADLQTGSIAITAGGDIALNSGGGTGAVTIRSLGNVTLTAANAGKNITQAANGTIIADVLTTSSGAGTSLLGTNQINSFNASSGTAGISLVNNQSLVLGAVSAGTGTQAINISTVGGSSNLTVGALSGDDNLSLSAGGQLVLTGALSGNTLSLTSGAQLELNHDITASGGLTLATTNGGNITQFTGAITVAGTTVASAGAGDITLANVANDFNQFSATAGVVLVHDVNGIALGASTVQSLALEAGGALALNGAVNASGAGDAVTLSSSAGAFDATGGSITTLSGRWLLYLAAPAGSNFGSLLPDFRQYGSVLGATVLGTGSGVLFGLSPTISASLGTGVHASKVYDGLSTLDLSDISILVTATGVQPGDVVTLGKVGLGVLDDPNVGLSKNVTQGVQIASATSSGMPVFGYTFLATGTTSSAASALIGDVTAATLTIGGVSASSRAYDGTTVASLAGSASVTPLGSDSVSVIGSGVGSFADKHVGTGKPVTVSGFTLSGPSAGNYLPLQPSGLTADITTANLTLTTSAVAKGYDGTTAAAGTAIVGSGTLFAGDTLSGGAFAYLDKHAGTGKSVTVGGVTVNDGNGGGNYVVTYADNTTSSISAAPLTVSASAVSKTYDGTTSAAGVPTVTSGTLFAGDTFSGGSFAFLDKNVGTNKTVTVSGVNIVDGNAGGNYSLTLVDNTTSTITQAESGDRRYRRRQPGLRRWNGGKPDRERQRDAVWQRHRHGRWRRCWQFCRQTCGHWQTGHRERLYAVGHRRGELPAAAAQRCGGRHHGGHPHPDHRGGGPGVRRHHGGTGHGGGQQRHVVRG